MLEPRIAMLKAVKDKLWQPITFCGWYNEKQQIQAPKMI
jgi:hypothetical protein